MCELATFSIIRGGALSHLSITLGVGRDYLFSSFSLRAAVAKRQLLGCLAHAPAREAFFVLRSHSAAAVLAFGALHVPLGEHGRFWATHKRETAI